MAELARFLSMRLPASIRVLLWKKTTQIYTHVSNPGGLGVRSPLDAAGEHWPIMLTIASATDHRNGEFR